MLATVNGGRHAHHIIHEGTTANDVTGVLALAAGVALVGLAAWIPFGHRGERTASPVKRWAIRAAVLPLGLLAAMFFYMPVGMAIVDIHSLHRAVGSPPSADYETVHLTTSDGLDLDAWYRPSRNGAAVLMMSGGGGDIRGTISHAKMLVPTATACCSSAVVAPATLLGSTAVIRAATLCARIRGGRWSASGTGSTD